MNKIEKLIDKLCPDGVEFKALGEVIISLKTGLNPRKNIVLNTDLLIDCTMSDPSFLLPRILLENSGQSLRRK